jgi:chemotaxis protein MotB
MGKKKHEEHENHERWLVSYADLMTLLFAFFVVLWSSSKSDRMKMEAVIDGMQAAFLGGPLPALGDVGKGQAPDTPLQPPLTVASARNPTMESLRTRLMGSLSDNVVQVGLIDNTLTVVVREQVLFSSGSADIHPSAYGTLTTLADAVRDEPVTLQVIGHADGAAISGPPFDDNWGLASARALSTVRAMQGRDLPMDQLASAAEITGSMNPERRAVTFRIVARDNAPTAGVLDKLHQEE